MCRYSLTACAALVSVAGAAQGQLNIVAATGTLSPGGSEFTKMRSFSAVGIEYREGGPPGITNSGILGFVAARAGAEPGEDIWGVYVGGQVVRE